MELSPWDLTYVAVGALALAAAWRISVKAGQPGWSQLLPVYGMASWLRVAGVRKPVAMAWLLAPGQVFIAVLLAVILGGDLFSFNESHLWGNPDKEDETTEAEVEPPPKTMSASQMAAQKQDGDEDAAKASKADELMPDMEAAPKAAKGKAEQGQAKLVEAEKKKQEKKIGKLPDQETLAATRVLAEKNLTMSQKDGLYKDLSKSLASLQDHPELAKLDSEQIGLLRDMVEVTAPVFEEGRQEQLFAALAAVESDWRSAVLIDWRDNIWDYRWTALAWIALVYTILAVAAVGFFNVQVGLQFSGGMWPGLLITGASAMALAAVMPSWLVFALGCVGLVGSVLLGFTGKAYGGGRLVHERV